MGRGAGTEPGCSKCPGEVCMEKHHREGRLVFVKVRTSDRRAFPIPSGASESADHGWLGPVWPPVMWAVAAGLVCVPAERGDRSHSLARRNPRRS